MTLNQEMVAEIAREVVARLQAQMGANGSAAASSTAIRDGVFPTVDEAVKAAAIAQMKVAELSLPDRGKAVEIIKRMCEQNADDWGRKEMEETKIGRLDHKIEKLKIVRQVLGVEAMRSDVRSDTTGVCLIERAPWGVIGMAAACDAFGADDGEQRDQRDCVGQHSGVLPASGWREVRGDGAAGVQSRNRSRTRHSEHAYDDGGSEH